MDWRQNIAHFCLKKNTVEILFRVFQLGPLINNELSLINIIFYAYS